MAKNIIVTCYNDGKVALTTIVNPQLDIIRFMQKLETIPVVHSCFETDVNNIKAMFPNGAINADRLTHNQGTLVYDPNRKNKSEIREEQRIALKSKLSAQLGLTQQEIDLLIK